MARKLITLLLLASVALAHAAPSLHLSKPKLHKPKVAKAAKVAPPADLKRLIIHKARQHAPNLDPRIVLALIHYESTFNPRAVSRDGSVGLMQVRQRVHAPLMRRLGVADLKQSDGNLRVGLHILQACIDRTGGNLRQALTAYKGADIHHPPPYADRILTLASRLPLP